ncbi:MAG: hypothetical protein J7525_19880 [Roseofilum sp. SID3]|nr:hypothetical protein [Roseofilum sp. SID3]
MAEISPSVSEFEIYEVANFRLDDGIGIGLPLTLSILAYAAREAITALGRSHAARLSAEIEREKAEREAEQNHIEYLEKQNKLLLQEILNLQQGNIRHIYPFCPLPPDYLAVLKQEQEDKAA